MSDIQTSTRTQVAYEISRANETYATQDESLHSEKEEVSGKYTYREWREISPKYVENNAHLLRHKGYDREGIMELVAEEWEHEDIYRAGSYKLREVKKTITMETSDDQQGNTLRRETVTDETTVFYTYFRTEEEFKAVMEKLTVKRAEWAARDAENERIEAEVQKRLNEEREQREQTAKSAAVRNGMAFPNYQPPEAPKKSFLDRFLGR